MTLVEPDGVIVDCASAVELMKYVFAVEETAMT